MAQTQNFNTVRNESTGAALEVILDSGADVFPYPQIEIAVRSNDAAVFAIAASHDGAEYFDTGDTITLSGSGEKVQGFVNSMRFVKVSTATIGNHVILISGGGK